jgi:hypothetical protein
MDRQIVGSCVVEFLQGGEIFRIGQPKSGRFAERFRRLTKLELEAALQRQAIFVAELAVEVRDALHVRVSDRALGNPPMSPRWLARLPAGPRLPGMHQLPVSSSSQPASADQFVPIVVHHFQFVKDVLNNI